MASNGSTVTRSEFYLHAEHTNGELKEIKNAVREIDQKLDMHTETSAYRRGGFAAIWALTVKVTPVIIAGIALFIVVAR